MMVVQLGLAMMPRGRLHAEGAAVVYHHGSEARNVVGKLLRHASAGRRKGDVHALEVIVVLQKFHLVFLTAETVFVARAAMRTEECEMVDGEVALGEHLEELLSYCAAGSYYCYIHFL